MGVTGVTYLTDRCFDVRQFTFSTAVSFPGAGTFGYIRQ